MKKNFLIIAILILIIVFIAKLAVSHGASGNLDSEDGTWHCTSDDTENTMIVNYESIYYIEIEGGKTQTGSYSDTRGYSSVDDKIPYGGKLKGTIQLNKGDILHFCTYKGGTANEGGGTGGTASMLFVNGIPVIGAGGAAGSTYDEGYVSSYGGYSFSRISPGQAVYKIDNQTFSAGGSGMSEAVKSKYRVTNPGATMEGCTPAPALCAGSNYINTDLCSLVIENNDGIKAQVTVYPKQLTVADLSKKINDIENSKPYPSLTVLQNREFSCEIPAYDKTEETKVYSDSSANIQISNAAKGDKVTMVTGKITEPGYKTITIDNITLHFNCIEEPTSANVKVILD